MYDGNKGGARVTRFSGGGAFGVQSWSPGGVWGGWKDGNSGFVIVVCGPR